MREHPLRQELEHEAHARPSLPIDTPSRVSHLAAVTGEQAVGDDIAHLTRLCSHFKATPPSLGETQATIDLGPVRMRWERHTEFSTYTFIQEAAFESPFKDTPVGAVPGDWLAEIPGQIVAAFHIAVEASDAEQRDTAAIAGLFDNNHVTGGVMLDGGAKMWTDFQVHADRFGRILLRIEEISAQSVGRLVQRVAEMETYRAMAMLAFPLARDERPKVAAAEDQLGDIIANLVNVEDTDAEQETLRELSRLAAESEAVAGEITYRFSATRAYHAIVRDRLASLREQRMPRYQPVSAFLLRRLEPAMESCENLARRQESLSRRISRASNLLRTRVDVALEAQNRDLLASMDRRARLQLRLQETVEGLSVVAVSYYLLSLVSYLAKGAVSASLTTIDPFIVVGIAFLPVVGVVALGVRHVRRRIEQETRTGD